MTSINKRFYFFNVNDTWFKCINTWSDIFRLKSYSFIKKKCFCKYCLTEINYTIEIDLLEDINSILQKFRNSLKQEIKKANKIGIVCEYKKDIDTFLPFFNEFAKNKHIYQPPKKTIQSIGMNIMTTFAYYEEKLIVAHSYIIDKEIGIARLFQSASSRLEENSNKQIISCANKLLTKNDIIYFKESGYKIYDLGGYALNTSNKSLQGINEFKLSFGGKITVLYSCYTYIYFLLKKITEILDRRYTISKK